MIQTLSRQRDSGTIVELVENEAGFRFVVKRVQNLEAPIYRAIFQKETQALTRLKACENIVRIFRSDIQAAPDGRSEGIISMEYVQGRPLSQMLDVIPNASTRYNLVKQLTNAIQHAHRNSVIHRDINPSNILITDSFELKLIDFGIAKIRGMFQDGTTYQFATQNYSAPEVTVHSENATERSDIYSLGAVIYFLFTGEVPVTATEMPTAIQSAGGIDVKLKEVLLKMCAPAPADRYENIDDCELALAPLYQRYCGSDERYFFAVPTNALDDLKRRNLVRRDMPYLELLDSFLPAQFAGGLIRLRAEGQTSIYCFDGISISMECVLSDDFFQVVSFRRLDAFKREQHKRFSMEVPGHFQFLFSHRIANTPLPNNCSQILSNRVADFQADIHSQKNIDREYDTQYGIWREFIQAMIADASKNTVRLYYTSVRYEDGMFLFRLDPDSVPDETFSQDTLFIFEQRGRFKKKPILAEVGTFWEYREDGAVMAIKAAPRKPRLPNNGSICLDYRKEIQQYRRQEAALEEFRRSETANGGNLKSIFVGAEQPGYFQLKAMPCFYNKQLDFTQKRAVRKALEAEDIALIQGPPGTGKTNVLVEVIRQILGENQRNPALDQKILIVSQSHAAVDKLLEDLAAYLEHTTIRIGHEENIDPKINERFGLDHCQTLWVKESVENCKAWLAQRLLEQHIPMEPFCKYAQVLEELKLANLEETERIRLERVATDFENTYGKSRTNPYVQSCLISEQWIRRISESNELGEFYIKNASIIVGTCIGVISDPRVRDSTFDYVIVAVIYRESRLANVVFQSTAESAELYRILDISYHTLSYQREFCFVYLNQADCSLAFHFQSGIQAYADVLAEQLNCRHLGAWNLFSPPNRPCAASPEEEQLPHDLIAAFKLRGAQSDWADLLEAAYYADRPLLDGELQDILYHCAAFKAPRIFIQAPFLAELLNDDILRTIFSAHTKEVIVRYNRNDYQADFILGRMGKLRKDCVLTTVPSEDISSVKFCFGTACFIQGQYAAKETVYKRRLYKLCAEITFNSAQIDSLWNNLLEIGSEAPSKS